ncbi:MAG TPA: hypothetical protein VGC02_01860 [Methanobacterium sp.]
MLPRTVIKKEKKSEKIHIKSNLKKNKQKIKLPENKLQISNKYKKRLKLIRKEVKEGKYSRFSNTRELAKKIGL